MLHSEHCVTTLKRVFDENSKFKSAIIAIYKQVHEIVPGTPIYRNWKCFCVRAFVEIVVAVSFLTFADKKKKEGDYAVEALETFLSLLRIPTTRIEFYRKITLVWPQTEFISDWNHRVVRDCILFSFLECKSEWMHRFGINVACRIDSNVLIALLSRFISLTY